MKSGETKVEIRGSGIMVDEKWQRGLMNWIDESNVNTSTCSRLCQRTHVMGDLWGRVLERATGTLQNKIVIDQYNVSPWTPQMKGHTSNKGGSRENGKWIQR